MNNDDIQFHPEMEPEEPEFIIERDDEGEPSEGPTEIPESNKWKKWLLWTIAVLTLLLLTCGAYKGWRLYNARKLGITISISPKQNIKKLQAPLKEQTAEVKCDSDSIMGVKFDYYELIGVRASIEFEEPKLTNDSVYLYCRSVDHDTDSTYLGSLVVNGVEIQSDRSSRLGYMAMMDDHMVIGVSRSEAVKDYVKENGGSFFRQFVLVSNGDVPPRFYLNGKKIRKAIGRMEDNKGDKIFFISTRNEVTVRDFANALRMYGFIDAIYITGGYDYCYYRDSNRQRHDIGDIKNYPQKNWKGIIPWLVFRKR